jgi:hypothetical protein
LCRGADEPDEPKKWKNNFFTEMKRLGSQDPKGSVTVETRPTTQTSRRPDRPTASYGDGTVTKATGTTPL